MKLTNEQRRAVEAVVIGTSDAEFERDPLGAMERLFAAGIAYAQRNALEVAHDLRGMADDVKHHSGYSSKLRQAADKLEDLK